MKKKFGLYLPDEEQGRWLKDLALDSYGIPRYQRVAMETLLNHCPYDRRRVFVDAGAHIGLWTLFMRRYFKIIRAFEPNEAAYECIVKNVAEYGYGKASISVNEVGLSDTCRWGTLWGSDGKSMSRSLHGHVPGDEANNVWLTTLDTFPLEHLDAIKIDVEGHQGAVLRGAIGHIEKHKPIIIMEEKHDPEMAGSVLLRELGMVPVWRGKRDYLWLWADDAERKKLDAVNIRRPKHPSHYSVNRSGPPYS